MPSHEDLGTANLHPPRLARVILAAKQPDLAWTQRVLGGPDGRRRHLSAVWDLALEARGVQAALRISFPWPIVVMEGSNLPEGQELVGMFAYRLVSEDWRVQTGVARIREEGTVTTAGVLGLNVVTGWQQRKPEWVDVAWLAMRIHVGRQRKGGGLTSLTSRGRRSPPPRPLGAEAESPAPPLPRKGTPMPPPPPPPEGPAYGHPGGAGGAGGAGGTAGAEADGGGLGGAAPSAGAGGGMGGARDERGGRQLRPRGVPVQGQRGHAGRRDAVGGTHQGQGPPCREGENPGARLGDGAQGRGGTGKATGIDRGGC